MMKHVCIYEDKSVVLPDWHQGESSHNKNLAPIISRGLRGNWVTEVLV